MPCSGLPVIWLFFAGIVAADLMRSIVIKGYTDLPADLRKSASETGEMWVDAKDSPIAGRICGDGRQIVGRRKTDEYFRDLRDFPAYNRIRNQFFPEPPASTVVRVLELLKV